MSKAQTAVGRPDAGQNPSRGRHADPAVRLAELLRRLEQQAAITREWLRAADEQRLANSGADRGEVAQRAGDAIAEALDGLQELEMPLPPSQERAREAMALPTSEQSGDEEQPQGAVDVREAAEERIFELEMVGAGAASELLGAKASNREKVRLLRNEGVLLGLPRSSRSRPHYRYPVFQFDRPRRVVHAAVAQVNKILGALDDPWGAASWWVAPNPWLGSAPHEAVASKPRDVIEAAEAAIEWTG